MPLMVTGKKITRLNLFPIYERAVLNEEKTATIRLGVTYAHLKVGSEIILTCGWNPEKAYDIARVIVEEVIVKKIKRLQPMDTFKESEELRFPLSVPIILSLIYRREVTPEDYVTIIKWRLLKVREAK